jgi:hypothetical protein
MKTVGFFRELRHGFPDGPSLRDSLYRTTVKPEFLSYLENGYVLAVASSAAVDDVLDSEKKYVATLDVRTDGEWLWPGDLSYYVSMYQVFVPDEFISYAERNNWVIPPFSSDEISHLLYEMEHVRD